MNSFVHTQDKFTQSFGMSKVPHGFNLQNRNTLVRWDKNTNFQWRGQEAHYVDNTPYDGTVVNTVTFGGGAKWNRGSFHPNGYGYMAPFSDTAILKVNPDLQTYTSIGSFSGSNKCAGMVAAPNRRLYCIPYDYAGIIVICPDDNDRTYVIPTEASLHYSDGVVASNGHLYMGLAATTTLGVLDTKNDAFRKIDLGGSTLFNFQSVVLYEDSVYFIPAHGGTPSFYNNRILKLETSTENVLFTGRDIPNGYAFIGAKVGINGRIYAAPYSGTNNILEYSPRTDQINYYDVGTSGFDGMVMCGDGDLLLIPHLNTCAGPVKFNTTTKAYTSLSWTAENGGYAGGFLADNGIVFATPHQATRRLEVNSARRNKLIDIDFVMYKQTR